MNRIYPRLLLSCAFTHNLHINAGGLKQYKFVFLDICCLSVICEIRLGDDADRLGEDGS